jgi:hypothetical protein
MFHVPKAHSQTGGVAERLIVYYFPNGRLPENWLPSAVGTDFDLPPGSAALEAYKSKLVFLSGLRDTAARLSTELAGDHARGTSGVATCTPLDDFLHLDHDVVSVDQLLADRLNPDTRFRSLQYGAGEPFACDRGASCAYTQALSWAGANRPLTPITDPLSAFNQLFGAAEGDTPEEQERRRNSLSRVLARRPAADCRARFGRGRPLRPAPRGRSAARPPAFLGGAWQHRQPPGSHA